MKIVAANSKGGFGQVENPLDEVVVDEPLAHALSLAGAGVAGDEWRSTNVEDDSGTAFVVETGVYVLHPTPASGRFLREIGTGGKAAKFVVVVICFGEPAGFFKETVNLNAGCGFFGAHGVVGGMILGWAGMGMGYGVTVSEIFASTAVSFSSIIMS